MKMTRMESTLTISLVIDDDDANDDDEMLMTISKETYVKLLLMHMLDNYLILILSLNLVT